MGAALSTSLSRCEKVCMKSMAMSGPARFELLSITQGLNLTEVAGNFTYLRNCQFELVQQSMVQSTLQEEPA